MTDIDRTLEAHAEEFADELTVTVEGTLGTVWDGFVAEASPIATRDRQRVSVHTVDSDAIPLSIDGQHALDLTVAFECAWDHQSCYLAVRKASFAVLPTDKGAPLFRYEFVDGMQPTIPSAHLHVHAHRDEFLFALFRGGHGKPAIRAKAADGRSNRAVPRLADVHFPLGGARMRPCLEDILQMLRTEFAIDVVPGFQDVLDGGRARWRRRQLGAAVRDAPAEAVRVLTEMGYGITDPPGGAMPEKTAKLTKM